MEHPYLTDVQQCYGAFDEMWQVNLYQYGNITAGIILPIIVMLVEIFFILCSKREDNRLNYAEMEGMHIVY